LLHALFEVEELVGRAWHRWATSDASWPDHPDAAVALDELLGPLGVFFRAAGGDPALGLGALAAQESGHRLRLRQRFGGARESVRVSRLDGEALLLPPTLAFFSQRRHNRLLFFWLAAHAACLDRAPVVDDPLHRDLLALCGALEAAHRACEHFPGLRRHYKELCVELLRMRPVRKLPAAEEAVEILIIEALGGVAPVPPDGSALSDWLCHCRRVLAGDAPLRARQAPRGYRPPLPVPLWSVVGVAPAAAQARPDAEPEAADPTAPAEQAAPGKRRAERRRQDQAERDDPLVFNRFEKLLSMAEMVNVNRLVDDEKDDNAARHAEQMDEITLSPHQQQAASRLRVELDLARDEAVGAPLEATLCYPEWHYRERRDLLDHCAVITAVQPPAAADGWQPDATTRRRIRRVRRQFEALRPQRQLERGQFDGSELDIDAVVRAIADQRAGGQGSDRVFMEHRAQERDLAVSALIDVSLSTEAWLEDRRVIDLEKEALLVLAHGIAACGDPFSMHSFTSRRRDRVWVNTLKDWHESLGPLVEQRIGALRPGAYTRMGAAIRHLTRLLAQRPQRHRLLLLLTDGKPNDTDYYEGRYAIEDTRRAVLDARQQGVRVFAVTIDSEARYYLQRIFGEGAYSIVARPLHLVSALPAIYRQLIRH
jgi:nitric oxide reductase NorD protein